MSNRINAASRLERLPPGAAGDPAARGLADALSGETSKRRRPHLLVMTTLFLVAIVAGVLLLPGETERLAMLERDGRNSDALRLLEARFAAGDRRQPTLYQMQRLYEQFGDIGKARQILELMVEQRPRDPTLRRQLAQFYRLTQDERAYLRALEAQLALRYSEPACRELIGLLRRNGEFEQEAAAIARCRSSGYRRPEDIVRLAFLVAADGNTREAAQLLRSVDDRRRLRTDRERIMLFAMLIESEQPQEALRRGVRWLKAARDDKLALTLITTLSSNKRHDLAIELAREVGVVGDSISLAIAELMLDRNQMIAARSYLRGWLEHAKFSGPPMAARFTTAALDAEDPELAFAGAQRFGLDRLPQTNLAAIAEALSAVGRVTDFQAIKDLLDPETLADNPLLAAAIELERGASEPARDLLAQVPLDELDEWRLALWSRLMESTGRGPTAAQTVRNVSATRTPGGILKSRVTRRVAPTRRAVAPAARAKAAPKVAVPKPPSQSPKPPPKFKFPPSFGDGG